ncbi:unnamed protein product, partial [Laminaria digitata]
VGPGGRLPLPLRWSRSEDIRLRPLLSCRGRGSNKATAKDLGNGLLTEQGEGREREEKGNGSEEEEGEGGSGRREEDGGYGYSDCSVLVPAARAGETELGVTMSVIPWVACNPSTPSTNTPGSTSTPHHNTANINKKPLFLFLEGIDVNSPGGGQSSIVPRGGGEASGASVAGSILRGKEGCESSARGRQRSDGNILSSSSGTPPPPHRQLPSSGPRSMRRASAPSTGLQAAAVLSHRPLEVVVYASLSFRNLLPVEVGWRVVGARGDAGAKVAEGRLGPGEGVHVLEANAMAMTPSLSFKVAGFDWTMPRQVVAVDGSRRRRAAAADRRAKEENVNARGRNPNSAAWGGGGGGGGSAQHVPGLGLETIACRNRSNQILYLSVEAASVRMNSVLVTVFAGFWVRNLSGLPLTLGEPVPAGLSAFELQQEMGIDRRDRAQRYSPSPPRGHSLCDVLVSAVQSEQHGMSEEVFELRSERGGHQGTDAYDTRWCTAQANPRMPYTQVRLPSDLWRWEGDWAIDRSGAVAPDAPGTDGGGWESCPRKPKGGHYGSTSFSPSRSFKLSDPIWRRRWVRRRVPCRPQAALGTDSVPNSVRNSVTDSANNSVQDAVKDSVKDLAASGRAGSAAAGKRRFGCHFIHATTLPGREHSTSRFKGRVDLSRQVLLYTVMNRCDCVLVVSQYGSDVSMELEPGESRPLHWADGRQETPPSSLEATLSVSVAAPRATEGSEGALMGWSGPVGIGNIGKFPICIRPMPGGAALPGKSF